MTVRNWGYRTSCLWPLLLTGCSLAPNFHLPQLSTPPAFKESSPVDGSFEPAADAKTLAALPLDWWSVFADPVLTDYIGEAVKDSPTLEAMGARLAEARALAGVSEANLYPQIAVGASPTRQQVSGAQIGLPVGELPKPKTIYRAQATVAYELDLFGGNTSAARSAEFRADAAEANYRAALLSLQADVAQSYFNLRTLDGELAILEKTVAIRQKSLELMKNRWDFGDVSKLDLDRARNELASTQSDFYATRQRRNENEHQLAILLGKPPSELSAKSMPIDGLPPEIPKQLPSSLLERRPDIQAAQADLAAANQTIGVARAAFFPSINLTGNAGFESVQADDLFRWSSRAWILGPLIGTAVTLPVFDGGRNSANLALSKAAYQESVGNYRQRVLVAFRETEDQLNGLHQLAYQARAQAEAVNASREAFELARQSYESGTIDYIDHIDTQRSLLAAERTQIQTLGNRYVSTIQLIRALGGGWHQNNKSPTQ